MKTQEFDNEETQCIEACVPEQREPFSENRIPKPRSFQLISCLKKPTLRGLARIDSKKGLFESHHLKKLLQSKRDFTESEIAKHQHKQLSHPLVESIQMPVEKQDHQPIRSEVVHQSQAKQHLIQNDLRTDHQFKDLEPNKRTKIKLKLRKASSISSKSQQNSGFKANDRINSRCESLSKGQKEGSTSINSLEQEQYKNQFLLIKQYQRDHKEMMDRLLNIIERQNAKKERQEPVVNGMKKCRNQTDEIIRVKEDKIRDLQNQRLLKLSNSLQRYASANNSVQKCSQISKFSNLQNDRNQPSFLEISGSIQKEQQLGSQRSLVQLQPSIKNQDKVSESQQSSRKKGLKLSNSIKKELVFESEKNSQICDIVQNKQQGCQGDEIQPFESSEKDEECLNEKSVTFLKPQSISPKKQSVTFEINFDGKGKTQNQTSLAEAFRKKFGERNKKQNSKVLKQNQAQENARFASQNISSNKPATNHKTVKKQIMFRDKRLRQNIKSLENDTVIITPRNKPFTQESVNQQMSTNLITSTQTSVCKSTKEPSKELLDRLIYGNKVKIDKKEMYELTRKNYQRLPEVSQKRVEEQKRLEAKERLDRIRLYQKKIRSSKSSLKNSINIVTEIEEFENSPELAIAKMR